MTVATRELLTVTKTAWGVWYSEWLVLNLSSKWSLALYHIPKYLSLLTDVILSPHSSNVPSVHTHTNPDSLFNILCDFAFVALGFLLSPYTASPSIYSEQ